MYVRIERVCVKEIKRSNMNPINEFHKLAEQLDRINEYRSNHPGAFKPGSYCHRVYEQIVQELDQVIP